MIPSLITSVALSLLACKTDPKDTGSDDTGTEIELLGIYIYDPGTADAAPISGVTVAFDTIDGERLEAISGEDGFAVVELDHNRFASAIAHADGRSFSVVTAAAVLPTYEAGYALATMPSWPLELTTSLPVSGGNGWASVSGALLNKVADEHPVVIRATNSPYEFLDVEGPTSYELDVLTGQDFSLVALEFEEDQNWGDDRIIAETFHRWAVVEQPAISGPTTVDVDFAEEVESLSFEGSVKAPADTILADQGFLYIVLFSGEAYSGFSPSTAPGADGSSYDFHLEYVDLAGHSPTTFVEVRGPDGSGSNLWMDGMPAEGAQDLGLLAPPRRTAPAGEGPFDWEEPISWTNSPDGERYLVYFGEPGQIGFVAASADETGFALPPLPSTSTMLVTGEIVGNLLAISDPDEDGDPELQAWDVGFLVSSPF